jgi:cyclophilin family peptidyl-prolyl cis-trans isomerase
VEDLGRVNEQPVLPFNAFGTLAWARNEFDNNRHGIRPRGSLLASTPCAICLPLCSASSQVFFLLKDSELTPVGANLLDGRFSVFGYVTDGQDILGSIKVRWYSKGRCCC